MIKKILMLIIVLIILFRVSICAQEKASTENNMVIKPITILINTISENESEIQTSKCNELIEKQKLLFHIKDEKKRFIAYKTLIEEYSDWCDPPETIYDYFDKDELRLLFQVVEAEVTGGNFSNKANVASIIFNRLNDANFGDSLSKILVKKQFSCISDGRYQRIKITEETILACEYVWIFGDTTEGCQYFESGSNNIHSFYADFQFEDSIGHRFYKERK